MATLKRRITVDDLPEDIIRLLFETMAGVDGLARTCATVSRQVKLWVEPILYRDVIVDEEGLFHRTVTASTSTKPPGFFATHVKSLLFNQWAQLLRTILNVPQILERCTAVRSLALWVPAATGSPELHDLLASGRLAPTHLSLEGYILRTGQDPFAVITFSHPIFRNVTHLEINWEDERWQWGSLGSLKRLTHLSLILHFRVEQLTPLVTTTLLHAPSNLRVLIIFPNYPSVLSDEEVLAMNRGRIDSRVVVTSTNPKHESFAIFDSQAKDQWGRPSTTRTTSWTLADDAIRRRTTRDRPPDFHIQCHTRVDMLNASGMQGRRQGLGPLREVRKESEYQGL